MKKMTTNLRCLAMTAALTLCVGTAHAASSAPPEALRPAGANDGYLRVKNSGQEQYMPPRFCPPGIELVTEDGCMKRSKPWYKGELLKVPAVTAQEALDVAYGKGSAVVVSIAPQGWQDTVIYWAYAPSYRHYP